MRRRVDRPWVRAGAVAAGLVAAAAAGLAAGCDRKHTARVSVVGSTSVQPFAEALGEEYHRRHPDVTVEVQGGGSGAGIKAATDGIADIGSVSRALKPDETGLEQVTIARDGVAVVVHPSNPIQTLTRRQIRDLFSGRITNWSQVGGDDRTVELVTREEGSGTREAFTHLVMGEAAIAPSALTQSSNGAIKQLVLRNPAAVGYMSLGLVGTDLKAVQVEQVVASEANVLNGTYTLARPFLFIHKGPLRPAAQAFVDFVLSPEGQGILEREGLVRAK